MNYTESIGLLYGLRLFGLKLGLENTRRLAEQAGNPQRHLRFIHIAGTNGKGSVAAMLESIYRTAGLRVGLYTSPHLVSFRERIQVQRQTISEADVVRLVEELREHARTGLKHVSNPSPAHQIASDRVDAGGPAAAQNREDGQDARPTFFEFVTVMALKYFVEQKCDLVIWETGLGGRLDATNIVTPIASIITNIEHDHQRWLGHDVKSIAAEKAGIIKPRVPVITATSEPEALTVIEQTALKEGSSITLVTPAHTVHPPLDQIKLPLLGWHQRMNAATALAAVEVLRPGLPVSTEAIRCGLENVWWPGRLQIVQRDRLGFGSLGRHSTAQRSSHLSPPAVPNGAREAEGKAQPPQQVHHKHLNQGGTKGRLPEARQCILLDGAHNASGATSLRAVLEEDFAGTRPALILGILQDKDWEVMCEVLAPVADRIVCVPVKSERGANPHDLALACRLTNNVAEVTVKESVTSALEATTEAGLVVVAGSLYLVGEALEVLQLESQPKADETGLNEWTPPPLI